MNVNNWLCVSEKNEVKYSPIVNNKIVELLTLYIEQLHRCLDIKNTSDSKEFMDMLKLKKAELDTENDEEYAILYFIDFVENKAIKILNNVIGLELTEHKSMISKIDFLLDTIKAEINWENKTQDSTIICLLNEISDLDTNLNDLNNIICKEKKIPVIINQTDLNFNIDVNDIEYINFDNLIGELDIFSYMLYNPLEKATNSSLFILN